MEPTDFVVTKISTKKLDNGGYRNITFCGREKLLPGYSSLYKTFIYYTRNGVDYKAKMFSIYGDDLDAATKKEVKEYTDYIKEAIAEEIYENSKTYEEFMEYRKRHYAELVETIEKASKEFYFSLT